MFVLHFNVVYDLLLNRRRTTWNLFVLQNKEANYYRKALLLLLLLLLLIIGKPALAHFGKHEQRINVNYCLCKIKQSHW